MKFKTTIAALGAVAMLAVPAVTMAAPLEVNSWDDVKKTNTTYDQTNVVGSNSAQITHNGWFVSGNKDGFPAQFDQTIAGNPGSRADAVHADLAKSAVGK